MKVLSDNFLNYEIWANNLTKIYGKGKEAVDAVKGIDLFVKSGVHGFLGPNGAGKTTTMNMLIGAISITKGEAKIKGKKAGSLEARELIGFLPQDPSFDERMTGEAYLTYMGQMSGLKRSYCRERVQELLFKLDMWEARNRKIKTYSGGMKQKIGLALVLLHKPELLILDEPTANLDPLGREQIINTIKEISSDLSIFVSSHILSEIEQMCDTVTIINKGQIILSDSIHNVKNLFRGDVFILNTDINERIIAIIESYAFIQNTWIDSKDNKIHIITNDFEQTKKEIPKLVIEKGGTLQEFSQPQLSLQEIFMRIIEQEGEKQK